MIDVLLAYDTNLDDMAALNMPITKMYCNNMDYNLVVKKIENFDKPPAWYKPIAIYDLLCDTKSEYILWLDIDTLILKQDFSLHNIHESNKNLYLSQDANGINSGVMLIKNCDEMKHFFNHVSELYDVFKNHGWWEQAAIIHLVTNNYLNIKENMEYVPQKIFNAYDRNLLATIDDGYVCGESFVLHMPSINKRTRMQTLKNYIAKYYPSLEGQHDNL